MITKIRRSVKTGRDKEERTMSLSDVMERLKPADVVAVCLIVVCGGLIALGNDSSITAILLAVSAYYFGHARNE